MLESVFTFITPMHIACVPLVIALTGIFKNFRWFNNSYSPLLALVFGVLLSFGLGGPVSSVIIAGLFIGLSASGLYSGTSAIKNDLVG